MNRFRTLRILGAILLAAGGLLLIFTLVLPYSRLIGKETLELSPDPEPPLPHRTPPILPIYSRLRGGQNYEAGIFLTIEKLSIKKAPVRANVVVDNLRPDYLNALISSVGHLYGTALPGEKGNSLIFGHSALPYLYSPGNFQTIFSKIDELKFGDIIKIEVGGKALNYKVEKGGLVDKNAVLSDFASRKSRITLLTCYPPGFKSQKYAVRALLID